MSPEIAILEQFASQLGLTIVPYGVEVKNVNGDTCSIMGIVAPGKLTIAFSTSEKAGNKFHVQPLVLKHMQDHGNIGIKLMHHLQLQIRYGESFDKIWSPFL